MANSASTAKATTDQKKSGSVDDPDAFFRRTTSRASPSDGAAAAPESPLKRLKELINEMPSGIERESEGTLVLSELLSIPAFVESNLLDATSPKDQPHVWTESLEASYGSYFSKDFKIMSPDERSQLARQNIKRGQFGMSAVYNTLAKIFSSCRLHLSEHSDELAQYTHIVKELEAWVEHR